MNVGDDTRRIAPDEVLRFGRSPELELPLGVDPPDNGISRSAGQLMWIGDRWWLLNTSESRSFEYVDQTRWPTVLAPKASIPVVPGNSFAVIVGANLRHCLRLSTSAGVYEPAPVLPWDENVTAVVMPTMRERRALVALCEGFLLDWPRYRPTAASYEEAGGRAGIEGSTVRKRIERFREKIVDRMGVELGGGDFRLAICRFVLTHRLITTYDLICLDEPEVD